MTNETDSYKNTFENVDQLVEFIYSLPALTLESIVVEYKRVVTQRQLLGKGIEKEDTKRGEYKITIVERHDEDFFYAMIANLSTIIAQREAELEELKRTKEEYRQELGDVRERPSDGDGAD